MKKEQKDKNNIASDLKEKQRQRPCPDCGEILQIAIGYPTWCSDCDWNLQPEEPEIIQWLKERYKRDPFERLYETIRQLRKAKISTPDVSENERNFTIDRLAVYLIALLVDLLLFLPVFSFLWFLRSEPTWVTAVFNSLPFLAISYWLWPDLGTKPDECLDSEKFPTLHNVVNKIARSVKAPPIKKIVISDAYNAGFATYGFRRTPVLILGWPYLAVLKRQELLALLGHELAHAVNEDPSRSFLVAVAIEILFKIYKALWFLRNWIISLTIWISAILIIGLIVTGIFVVGTFATLVSGAIILTAISLVPLLGIFGFRYFLWREHYRAEFRADQLAAQVGGTKATVGILKKSSWGYTVAMAINLHYRQLIKTKHYQDLAHLLKKHIEESPPKELERLKRVETKHAQQISDTHPATTVRIAALEAKPITTPSVTISETDWQAFEKELAELMTDVQKKWYVTYLKRRSGVPV